MMPVRKAALAAGVVLALLLGVAGYARLASSREPVRSDGARGAALALAARAEGVEGSIPLREAAQRILRCRRDMPAPGGRCATALYIWSPLMPLSRAGLPQVRRAAEEIGVDLLIVDGSELEARAAALFPSTRARTAVARPLVPEDSVTAEMIGAGATVHYPSLLIYRGGRPAGAAILGYKVEAAYRELIGRRLGAASPPLQRSTQPRPAPRADTLTLSVEFPVSGRPGAYFRSVPGRRTIAYEAGSVVRLLDLGDGSTAVAPGHIDFVPTPDGRLFVTPARNGGGMQFYDAAEVFAAARRGDGRDVRPIHLDPELRDQYPSVGILASEVDGTVRTTVYRVLTSWFDGISFRDYEVRTEGVGGRSTVRPLDARMSACPQVSLPIISPDARELAGRDEASATTRIFQIGEDGECREAADLGLQTGKVAWSPDGERVAFAVPRGAARGIGGADRALTGIFLFDRETRELRRVPGSEDASRLAFPEFVGADSLVYLLTPQAPRGRSVFRVVCCMN